MADETQVKKRRWRYQIDLGPLSIIVWGICIFFFLVWIFVLGIFVGRGFLPDKISDLSDLKGEINKLHDTVETKEAKETKASTPSSLPENEPKLAFYDKLTTKKDEAKSSLQNEIAAEIPKTPVPLKETIPAQPAAGDKKEAAPSSSVTTPKPGAGKYTIQIASIADLAKAQKTVKQLVEKGFDAYYYVTKVKGKTYYRVRCGKFSDRAEAVKTALKLQEKTGYIGYVTGSE